jgi:hypothetical protein
VTVVDLLTGWLGLVIIGAAVAAALTLEVADERASAATGPTAGRARLLRRGLTAAVVVLVLLVLTATGVRLIALGE